MNHRARPGRIDLADRVVVITGGAKGIGAAVARGAHARGARVALLDVDGTAARATALTLGERAIGVACDITDTESLDAAVAAVLDRFGRIDVVLANAGIAPPSRSVADIDPADFERTIEINLLGQWRTARAVLPALTESGGHLLFVSSIYAFFNGVLNASYAMSKAGVEQLSRALRAELAHTGATAGVAYLGFVRTDLVDEVFAQHQVATFRKSLPGFLTRPISADDAAAALLAGIESRAARVTAPAWVRPALLGRGLTDPLADRIVAWRAAAAVREAHVQRATAGRD